MRGIVIFCPNADCRKHLIRDAKLRISTTFMMRCFNCGEIIRITATPEGITRQRLDESHIPEEETRPEGPKRDDDDLFGMIVNN